MDDIQEAPNLTREVEELTTVVFLERDMGGIYETQNLGAGS